MTLQFLDPRSQPGADPEPYELSIDLEGQQTVGLLANGFPDSVRFLDCIERALSVRFPQVTIKRFDKGNATVPAAGPLLSSIAEECRAVITAYGH